MNKDNNKLIETLAFDVKRTVDSQISNESVRRKVYKKLMEYKVQDLKKTNQIPYVSNEDVNKAEFDYYCQQWVKNTILSSDSSVIFSDDNFKNIIDMGKKVIPFIYNILKERASFLVYALQYIYGYGLSDGKYKPIDVLCNLWIKEIERTNYGRENN